jgi:glycine C-acetyltransferase
MEPYVKHPSSGSNDLKDFISNHKNKSFHHRINLFTGFLQEINQHCQHTYGRLVVSQADREVKIKDPFNGKLRNMLMFASNNYLGFASHPYVKMKVKQAIDRYGVGIGGPPLLNGYSKLMQELEERLASLKQKESAMIFPAGYAANLGIVTALVKSNDLVIYDELSHASFLDGLKMAHVDAVSFGHNDLQHLREEHALNSKQYANIFLGIEGVYSMDGDCAPLDKIIPFCKSNKIISILDDAHGTGILGQNGAGTAELYNCCQDIDISMGTFSKVFAVSGGFVAADQAIVEYMKYFARSFMFSASLPPMTLAAVLAGLDLIEKEPELREKLVANVSYAKSKLSGIEFCHHPNAAILSLKAPQNINIRRLNYFLHEKGLFLNAIEYPAVPKDQQRIRISLMCNHTEKDIDYLAENLYEAYSNMFCFNESISS